MNVDAALSANQATPTGEPDQRSRDKWLLLATIGAGDIDAARMFWETHAPKNFKGLLSGDGWTWDDQQQVYRSRSGRKFGGDDLKNLSLLFALIAAQEMSHEASNMAVGLLPMDEWQRRMADTVKDTQITQGALSAGGWGNLTPPLIERVQGTPDEPPGIAYSLDKLADFAVDVYENNERASTEDEIVYRAGLYASSSSTTFEDIKRESHVGVRDERGRLKYLFERNILGEAKHCRSNGIEVGCIECTDAGWVEIGTLPLPGLRPCGMNCKCSMAYSLTGGAAETN